MGTLPILYIDAKREDELQKFLKKHKKVEDKIFFRLFELLCIV